MASFKEEFNHLLKIGDQDLQFFKPVPLNVTGFTGDNFTRITISSQEDWMGRHFIAVSVGEYKPWHHPILEFWPEGRVKITAIIRHEYEACLLALNHLKFNRLKTLIEKNSPDLSLNRRNSCEIVVSCRKWFG
jgi:hypothetical protein